MGYVIIALLVGITAVEEVIGFMFYIEQESIQIIQMAVFQCIRYNQKAEAKKLMDELENKYLKMLYADLDTVWGGGMGFDVGGTHFSAFYGHGSFKMFADALSSQIQSYKKFL